MDDTNGIRRLLYGGGGKLRKARKQWLRLSRILGWEGADPWTYGNFYKTVVWATLIFGAETWAMSPKIGKTLGRFHHRMPLQMAGMRPRRDMMGRWVYPLLDAAMTALCLEEVETYIIRHQNIAAQYIGTHPIL